MRNRSGSPPVAAALRERFLQGGSMSLLRFLIGLSSLGVAIPWTGVSAQDYPRKPIRIVTSQIGGGSDFAARLVAQGLTESMGQQVIIDNRPAGIVPGDVTSRALPDGYTVL